MIPGAPRLCLIEDDPIMGESLVDRFTLEGFALDWYQTGGAALEAMKRHRYSAIISDVRLPDISGEQVFLTTVEQADLVPPFIFITAFASVERAVEMLKQGATDYITKPFDIGELMAKIRLAVGQHASPAPTTHESPIGISQQMLALAESLPSVRQCQRA